MGIYAALDYLVGAIRICKAKRGAQVYETQFKTAQTVL